MRPRAIRQHHFRRRFVAAPPAASPAARRRRYSRGYMLYRPPSNSAQKVPVMIRQIFVAREPALVRLQRRRQ